MIETIYGIHNNDKVMFFSLEAAEDYLIEHNPEYCGGKDATYDFCENMIWEDNIVKCEGCNESALKDDMHKQRQCHEYCCYILLCDNCD